MRRQWRMPVAELEPPSLLSFFNSSAPPVDGSISAWRCGKTTVPL